MTRIVYSPPGHDPTTEEHPIPGPTISGCLLRLAIIGGIVAAIVWGIGFVAQNAKPKAAPPTATPFEPTAYPTYTPYPTYTALPMIVTQAPPTMTYTGVWTPIPTKTATATIIPSATYTPTETPLPPGFLATWTPGPWILTRFAATYETRTPTPDPITAPSSSPTRAAGQRAH